MLGETHSFSIINSYTNDVPKKISMADHIAQQANYQNKKHKIPIYYILLCFPGPVWNTCGIVE